MLIPFVAAVDGLPAVVVLIALMLKADQMLTCLVGLLDFPNFQK